MGTETKLRQTFILPGYFAGAKPYAGLAAYLTEQGFPTVTVPLRQWDWLPTLGGRPITPILQQLQETIDLHTTANEPINLIGHSAGGWLGRIFLGDQPYPDPEWDPHQPVKTWNARARIKTIVCLGTPHLSQEPWTRRNIDFVNDRYPGAFYPDVHYVCVAGKAIFGQRGWQHNWRTNLAYNSYELTCGTGETWGDGITPVTAAHLEGATNLILEGVVHSPGTPQPWYGTPTIVEQWCHYLNVNL